MKITKQYITETIIRLMESAEQAKECETIIDDLKKEYDPLFDKWRLIEKEYIRSQKNLKKIFDNEKFKKRYELIRDWIGQYRKEFLDRSNGIYYMEMNTLRGIKNDVDGYLDKFNESLEFIKEKSPKELESILAKVTKK